MFLSVLVPASEPSQLTVICWTAPTSDVSTGAFGGVVVPANGALSTVKFGGGEATAAWILKLVPTVSMPRLSKGVPAGPVTFATAVPERRNWAVVGDALCSSVSRMVLLNAVTLP